LDQKKIKLIENLFNNGVEIEQVKSQKEKGKNEKLIGKKKNSLDLIILVLEWKFFLF